AFRESFVGCSWQRCKVHFMRNIMAHIHRRDKDFFDSRLKQIWLQPNYLRAITYAKELMDEYEEHYPAAIQVWKQVWKTLFRSTIFTRSITEKSHRPICWND